MWRPTPRMRSRGSDDCCQRRDRSRRTRHLRSCAIAAPTMLRFSPRDGPRKPRSRFTSALIARFARKDRARTIGVDAATRILARMDKPSHDPTSPSAQPDIETRIDTLKAQAAELSGGRMTTGAISPISSEIEERFWKEIIAFETAPDVEPFALLPERGLSLPAPDSLGDVALHAKLWEVIEAMADIGMVLEFTDHLSDRELYTQLWSHTLRDPIPLTPDDGGTWHMDMSYGDDARAYLKYYADEEARREWAAKWPDVDMP